MALLLIEYQPYLTSLDDFKLFFSLTSVKHVIFYFQWCLSTNGFNLFFIFASHYYIKD